MNVINPVNREVVTPITFSRMLLLAAAVAVLVSCGNKGDLFLPSDTIAPEELEGASEKLKKRKPATPE